MKNSIDNKEHIKEAFYLLKTRQDVASLLEIKDISLRYFLFKRRPETMYQSFSIIKKSGGSRKISAPKDELKTIQKKLAHVLECVYEPKICAFGFINKRDFIDNAEKHVKRNLVLNIDLKDFFEQIHFGRIRGMLMKPPYNIGIEAATTIAQLACYLGVLPQGAPSSPILTNMICAPLDNSLMRFAKSINCTYTRYVDDISFSTYKKSFDKSLVYVENDTVYLGEKLLNILKHHSFSVNPEKISLRSNYERQEVTGLTVNRFVNLRRSYIKQLRAILHNSEKQDLYTAAQKYAIKECPYNKSIHSIINNPEKAEDVKAWFKQVLKGKILYIGQVKGKDSLTYLSFAKKFNTIAEESFFDVSALDTLENLISNNTFILEHSTESEYKQGSGFYLKPFGLLTCFHVTKNDLAFEVSSPVTCSNRQKTTIKKSLTEISSDEGIDFSLHNFMCTLNRVSRFNYGDSTNLKTGDKVIITGYPNYMWGNSPYIQTCDITSEKTYHGAKFFCVSGRVVHGASGGPVLNEKHEVIGILKGGIATLADETSDENQGFVPIHLIVEFLNKQNISENQ